MARKSLQERLDELTVAGELYEVVDAEAKSLRCYACAHRCLIKEGRRGICHVRYNEGGVLRVPHGYVAALQVDPTEKKPFFHLLPGSTALSFGMLGCDFHCSYCQNWVTSQTLRDDRAGRPPEPISAQELVRLAQSYGASCIASTYNEPLITSEWAVSVFRRARAAGMRTLYISNGNATPEALAYLRPWLDAYKIDLKTMQDKQYRRLGGVLQHVLDTIKMAREVGLWVEVVTLIVPGFNDSNEELWDAARYIASVSRDIPWHVTAFHPDYKMTDPGRTPPETLVRAAEIGLEAGLHYVYAGNLPGATEDWENTRCPSCKATLIRRHGFYVLENRLARTGGRCPECGTAIPGVWTMPEPAAEPA
ncbi:MAG: AmmeMemoRadiSam system radical SAM enzyme [Anaerolineae bacterium]|nr:AmmeMemoRadiSam system radical SAM enzyme [Anaerolineae bacterium]